MRISSFSPTRPKSDGRSENDLARRKQKAGLDKNEDKFFKKWVKALGYLSENPRHNSLGSHEIEDLTRKYTIKIFQSYLENRTPAAGRMFWTYGPDKGDITILGIEPHPEDQKRGAYERVKLAAMPATTDEPEEKRKRN